MADATSFPVNARFKMNIIPTMELGQPGETLYVRNLNERVNLRGLCMAYLPNL